MDLSLQARLGRDLLLNGGLSSGKTVSDNCDVVTKVDNPSTYNCRLETPLHTRAPCVVARTSQVWPRSPSRTW